MKIQSLLSLLFSLLLISGCASLGKKFTPVTSFNKSKALIYIYRVPRFAGSAGSPYACLDNKVIGEIVDGGYFAIEVPPGKHTLSTQSLMAHTNKLTFNARAGKTYYLRSDFSATKQGTGAGLVGNAIWGAGSDEKNKILAALDTSVQKKTDDPSFLFVKASFAKDEIKKNKEFTVPEYKKNHCQKKKKKAKNKK